MGVIRLSDAVICRFTRAVAAVKGGGGGNFEACQCLLQGFKHRLLYWELWGRCQSHLLPVEATYRWDNVLLWFIDTKISRH
ncbi:hypothetical protein PBY51_005738 [Eleginops maclovinus]|uniref:Uncharacterized protein n=1 Tax=Eleginops maclovinus TaxID=56733 RepID=A0AAN7WN19_ELEMC|nr:hypothetical protein PBY51_005738 [Eleginops maclovinus]